MKAGRLLCHAWLWCKALNKRVHRQRDQWVYVGETTEVLGDPVVRVYLKDPEGNTYETQVWTGFIAQAENAAPYLLML